MRASFFVAIRSPIICSFCRYRTLFRLVGTVTFFRHVIPVHYHTRKKNSRKFCFFNQKFTTNKLHIIRPFLRSIKAAYPQEHYGMHQNPVLYPSMFNTCLLISYEIRLFRTTMKFYHFSIVFFKLVSFIILLFRIFISSSVPSAYL